jgi:hypothetical protein
MKISTHLEAVNTIMAEKTAELASTELPALEGYLLETPEFMSHYHEIVVNMILLFLLSFVLIIGLSLIECCTKLNLKSLHGSFLFLHYYGLQYR